jgi:hypothetical protein
MKGRRYVFASLLLVAAVSTSLALSACGAGQEEDVTEPADATADEEFPSIDERIARDFSDTAWFADVDHLAQTTKLRHPVTEVWFAVSVDEVRAEHLQALQTDLLGMPTDEYLHVDVYGTDGKAGAFGGGPTGEESVGLPASPASAAELEVWMDEAYGSGSPEAPEEWYGHITGYSYELDAWDGEKVAVVFTDIEYTSGGWSPGDEMAELIRLAVGTSGADWATHVRVVYADGDNVSTAPIDFYNPYQGY